MEEKKSIERDNKDSVYLSVLEDGKSLLNILPWIFVVAFVEAARKVHLHFSWVPFFVLDNEPLLTLSSYAPLLYAFCAGFLVYFITLKTCENYFNKNTKLVDFLMKARKEIFLSVALIAFMFFMFSWYALDDRQKGLVYISPDYKVYNYGDHSIVYDVSSNIPLVSCKIWAVKDVCKEEWF